MSLEPIQIEQFEIDPTKPGPKENQTYQDLILNAKLGDLPGTLADYIQAEHGNSTSVTNYMIARIPSLSSAGRITVHTQWDSSTKEPNSCDVTLEYLESVSGRDVINVRSAILSAGLKKVIESDE